MPSDELNLIVTAVLVARETGGDVTEVFTRLIVTIRERAQLVEKVKTLTIQGKIQGFIMMALPIVFAMITFTTNKDFFQVFVTDEVGRLMFMVACILQVLGMFLIIKFGRIKI